MLNLLLGLLLTQAPEVLSAPQQATIRRLDGTVVSCVAQQVLEGHETRKGRWVILPPPPTDPYGFGALLNRYRASLGRRPVVYSASLTAWAVKNNSAQRILGLGHWVFSGGYQDSAWNYPSTQAVLSGWQRSPGHNATLLAPVSSYGIAWNPPFWTANFQ